MRVKVGPAGNVTYVVNNAVMATYLLLNAWPTEGGPAHLAARVASMAAIEGGDPAAASVAFEAAAREADVLVR